MENSDGQTQTSVPFAVRPARVKRVTGLPAVSMTSAAKRPAVTGSQPLDQTPPWASILTCASGPAPLPPAAGPVTTPATGDWSVPLARSWLSVIWTALGATGREAWGWPLVAGDAAGVVRSTVEA